MQVNCHDEGVSRCYLRGRNSIALLDRRVCVATGVVDRIDIKSRGSFSEITGQVLFLVARFGGVASNDRCSKLRLEQVRILEGNCCDNGKFSSLLSSVQEDVAASGEIQDEEAAVVDGFSGADVPCGCRRGRVVAYAYVKIAKLILAAN